MVKYKDTQMQKPTKAYDKQISDLSNACVATSSSRGREDNYLFFILIFTAANSNCNVLQDAKVHVDIGATKQFLVKQIGHKGTVRYVKPGLLQQFVHCVWL